MYKVMYTKEGTRCEFFVLAKDMISRAGELNKDDAVSDVRLYYLDNGKWEEW